jgi:hypothetical protein
LFFFKMTKEFKEFFVFTSKHYMFAHKFLGQGTFYVVYVKKYKKYLMNSVAASKIVFIFTWTQKIFF